MHYASRCNVLDDEKRSQASLSRIQMTIQVVIIGVTMKSAFIMNHQQRRHMKDWLAALSHIKRQLKFSSHALMKLDDISINSEKDHAWQGKCGDCICGAAKPPVTTFLYPRTLSYQTTK
ncbi:hypothetical protein LSTR_LSTR008489 [Laodelphax striatellus]|uniref:Uncharacterized protein n=1 Tax=Laodelphax striatellus TaxID=195883 RepID=A0A482WQM8_LAOST|nr:hypothetical protein LSTR_LSTR008489 [Laodelphax striatellus]